MDHNEKVVRQLEDFILAAQGLQSVGNLPFDHHGKMEIGYPYIRASNQSLMVALGQLERLLEKPVNEIQFLEIGCGIGTKCELARLLGMKASGIDLLPEYVDLAKQVYPACTFWHANAFECDFQSFDVVYYHVPFFDDDLVRQLEDRVLSHIRQGAVLIVTRISETMANDRAGDATSRRGYTVQRPDFAEDIGRLIVLQKS